MNAYTIQDTPEKFQPMAEELVPPLLELLRARNDLEREIQERFQALEAEDRKSVV